MSKGKTGGLSISQDDLAAFDDTGPSSFKVSSNIYTAQDLSAGNAHKLPLIVRVEDGLYGQTDWTTISSSEILFLYRKDQRMRALMSTSDGTRYSFPIDYPVQFSIYNLNENSTQQKTGHSPEPIYHEASSHPAPLKDIVAKNKLPITVLLDDADVCFSVVSGDGSFVQFGKLTITHLYHEKYFVGNEIRNGHLCHEISLLPTTSRIKIRLVQGLGNKQKGKPSWKNMVADWISGASKVNYDAVILPQDVVEFKADVVAKAIKNPSKLETIEPSTYIRFTYKHEPFDHAYEELPNFPASPVPAESVVSTFKGGGGGGGGGSHAPAEVSGGRSNSHRPFDRAFSESADFYDDTVRTVNPVQPSINPKFELPGHKEQPYFRSDASDKQNKAPKKNGDYFHAAQMASTGPRIPPKGVVHNRAPLPLPNSKTRFAEFRSGSDETVNILSSSDPRSWRGLQRDSIPDGNWTAPEYAPPRNDIPNDEAGYASMWGELGEFSPPFDAQQSPLLNAVHKETHRSGSLDTRMFKQPSASDMQVSKTYDKRTVPMPPPMKTSERDEPPQVLIEPKSIYPGNKSSPKDRPRGKSNPMQKQKDARTINHSDNKLPVANFSKPYCATPDKTYAPPKPTPKSIQSSESRKQQLSKAKVPTPPDLETELAHRKTPDRGMDSPSADHHGPVSGSAVIMALKEKLPPSKFADTDSNFSRPPVEHPLLPPRYGENPTTGSQFRNPPSEPKTKSGRRPSDMASESGRRPSDMASETGRRPSDMAFESRRRPSETTSEDYELFHSKDKSNAHNYDGVSQDPLPLPPEFPRPDSSKAKAFCPQPTPKEKKRDDPPSSIRTVSDIPKQLEGLSCSQLADCLKVLKMDGYIENFLENQIDGKLLLELDEDILMSDLKVSKLHAKKLFMFARQGWRP